MLRLPTVLANSLSRTTGADEARNSPPAEAPLGRTASEPVNRSQGTVRQPSSGQSTKEKLYALFARTGRPRRARTGSLDKPPLCGASPLYAGVTSDGQLGDILATAQHKLARDKPAMAETLGAWAENPGDESGLHPRLRKFIEPGKHSDRIDGFSRDGLRSAITGLKAVQQSNVSPALKARAEWLAQAPLLRIVRYVDQQRQTETLNVEQFGTHDTYKYLDALNLPGDERKQIAERLLTALDEIGDIFDHASRMPTAQPPVPRFDMSGPVDVVAGFAGPTSPPAAALPSRHVEDARPETVAASVAELRDQLRYAVGTGSRVRLIRALRAHATPDSELARALDIATSEMLRSLQREKKDASMPALRAQLEGEIRLVGEVSQEVGSRPSDVQRRRHIRKLFQNLRRAPDASAEALALAELRKLSEHDARLAVYLEKDFKPRFTQPDNQA